jgi:hypothetical protein
VRTTASGGAYTDWRTTALGQGTNPTDHANLSNLQYAATAVLWGHVNDQAQTIAGAKTWSDIATFSKNVKLNKLSVAYAASVSLDLSAASDFLIADLTGALSLVLTNFSTYPGSKWHIYLKQDATGGRVVTLSTGFGKNFGATTIATTASKETIITCWVNRGATAVDYIITNE